VTTNRPTPEGAWDHDLPYILEDKTAVETNVVPAKPTPLLAVAILHRTKENIQMLKGWKTIAVAAAIAALGVVQSVGLSDIIPPAYVGPVMMGIGFVMAWLRSQSDTTVFTNTSPAPTPKTSTAKTSGTF
jgi:protein-S-isoprenylcysteine O-methyltransferase Ste14